MNDHDPAASPKPSQRKTDFEPFGRQPREIKLPRPVAILVLIAIVGGVPAAAFLVSGAVGDVSPHYMFSALFAFLAVVMLGMSFAMLRRWLAVRRWRQAPALITRSELVRGLGIKGGVTQLPMLSYQYSVEGKIYSGNRIKFYGYVSGASAVALIDRCPVGSTVSIFYDPLNPAESVFERRFGVAFFLPFAAIALAVLSVIFALLPPRVGG